MAFQKDKDILTSTFSSLWDKMKWKASRILKDADEAEDVLQETFVRLWSKDYRIESEAQASALLGKSIRNESINRTRRKKAGPLDRDIGIEDDDGSEASRKEELLSEIESIIDRELSDSQKYILRRKEYEGASFETIAEELGMEPTAARMQLSRARQKIREIYRARHGSDN